MTTLTYIEVGEICMPLVFASSVSCDVAALVSHGLSGYYIYSQHLAGFERVLVWVWLLLWVRVWVWVW